MAVAITRAKPMVRMGKTPLFTRAAHMSRAQGCRPRHGAFEPMRRGALRSCYRNARAKLVSARTSPAALGVGGTRRRCHHQAGFIDFYSLVQ